MARPLVLLPRSQVLSGLPQSRLQPRLSRGQNPRLSQSRLPTVKAPTAKAPTKAPTVKAPASTTPVVPQPFHPVKSKVNMSNIALRRILLSTATKTDLATGMREEFVQGKPSKSNAKTNHEQTSNESEVVGFSGEEQGSIPAH